MEKIKCSTEDLAVENAAKLIRLFPEVADEAGGVNFDKLRQVLSSQVVEGNVERYEFTWPGKRAAMAAASAATTKTLRPCLAESAGRDGTPGKFDSQNLYIEGDNLEVLKILQRDYADRVKMIYIDPPYNTGHDFVYRDRFSLTQREIDDEAGAFDEDGNRFEVNDSAEARYHSNWCSMIYPRLKLARNLLRDDGVIFISIDDNEVMNLRKLCDEIFGENCFVANLIWQKKFSRSNDATYFSTMHDHVLCYCKNNILSNPLGWEIGLLPRGTEIPDGYSNPDNDPRGVWTSVILSAKSGSDSLLYEITTPSGRKVLPPSGRYWSCSKETFQKWAADNRIWFGVDGDGTPRKKTFLSEVQAGLRPNTILMQTEAGNNQEAKQEVKALFDGVGVFDGPKPVRLLVMLLTIANLRDGDICLDFFSGSAASAHAVMQLNSENGGNRKFIMVQLEEPCDEGSEAEKAGYANICEIGKERIRRAGRKIAEENATTAPNLDIGFRVLKLDSSSLNDTSATVGDTTQEFENFNRIKSDRKPEDLLFQLLVETRIPLSDPIAKVKVGGNKVFFVGVDGGGAVAMQNAPLAACLDPKAKLTNEFFIELAKLTPGIVFFRDDAFVDDSARVNVEQIFAQFSPTTSIKVV